MVDNYDLTHAQTDYLLSCPGEKGFSVDEEAQFLREKTDSARELQLLAELDGAVVGNGAIVAAGAVVLQRTQIPPYEIWGGIPARRLKAAAKGQAEAYAQSYMEVKEIYRQEP